ncbi:glycine--tRNA ligase subunit beta [Legionella sp. km772]|uniref:glycine--tRNA ligase subunit beta n=1 Tax=Legionella sp. km772 TaxID=2498111 RepID=UPI000F8E39B9|nr:glycine--tRNA ligase subunit beta [Legionella sp. km772]RUR12680.1 glycine--tRNA ligase subunit beta [Legionella sp. km772]
MVNDFIFELGCEELPSGAVWTLANEFANNLLASLDKTQLSYGEVKRFATPRRLALVVYDLQTEQASQLITRRGPAAIAAFDKEGKPTPALSGFAKSCGVDVSQLSRIQTDKGEWMVYETQQAGGLTKNLLPELVKQALANLPIAKPMRWGDGDDEFARPVHWAVMLYGDELISTQILGVDTGRNSRGHRFHSPQEFPVRSAKAYEQQLKEAYVIADFAVRRKLIFEQINQLAETLNATAVMPEELLDEVSSIVEWPKGLLANFEKEFLDVPAEALIASMQAHQKCFALKDQQGNLLPHFITVSNIESTRPEQVVLGNEKVMRARLSDAAFFFRQDKKQALSQHIKATENVVFQEKLGSLYQKAERVQQLMVYLSTVLALPQQQAERAAELSKCDLLSGMVGEFPELQGLMGYYYALHDGEALEVARALDEQYMPRFAADSLPDSVLGKALSLADRIDTLVGIFAIGQKPSGVKDPFKLRRHALAVVRILASITTPINISDLIDQSIRIYGSILPADRSSLTELKPFILDRLNSYYQNQNFTIDLIQAVRARQDECFYDLESRLKALKNFIGLPEAASLSAACKRVGNILNSAGVSPTSYALNEQLLEEGAEKALYVQLRQLHQRVNAFYDEKEYNAVLKELAGIKEPVDAFFDNVMVMVENETVKHNRLALLTHLQDLLRGVADISMLQLI